MMSSKVSHSPSVTLASKAFDSFFSEEHFSQILLHFDNMCTILALSPGPINSFYGPLKNKIVSSSAKNMFNCLDAKIKHPIYEGGRAASGQTVIVVGCGPVGLRTAIEAHLLGAHVICLEKRTDFTRNNVLHLWPYVIEDLKSLGAKILYPRFCTGSMNHISIRRLQCVLLKVSLLLGIQIYAGIGFSSLIAPTLERGWRIQVDVESHPVSEFEIDMIIGAEGKRTTLPGFHRKEFRGKLAIAITANFVNSKTTAEAVVEEISGVAFVYKQDFFNSLYEELGIALENIVYYKGETHYFVMTTKKHSLLDRGVLKKDFKDPKILLSSLNIETENLLSYIRDACDYVTNYQLPNLTFELNHHREPDVALFDFTSMFAANNSAYVSEEHERQLLLTLVGDGLLEPFWPTGTGIARGFLGALDAVWMLKEWSAGEKSPQEVLAERESIFRLLPQTTPENIAKEFKNYTIEPSSRYPNLNRKLYSETQMESLYRCSLPSNGTLARKYHVHFSSSKTYNKSLSSVSLTGSLSQKDLVDLYSRTPLSSSYPRSYLDFLVSSSSSANLSSNRGIEKSLEYKGKQTIRQTKINATHNKEIDQRERHEKGKEVYKCVKAPKRGMKACKTSSFVSLNGDTELDALLDELEKDANFTNLSENEQRTWLESLFFTDGPSSFSTLLNKPNSQPVKPNSQPVKTNSQPVRTDFLENKSSNVPEKPYFSDKSEKNNGVNMRLCSLAQSYFSKGFSNHQNIKNEEEKEDKTQITIQQQYQPRERVSFTPKDEVMIEEEEVEEPPRPPPRSLENKSRMLKLVKSATLALQ